MSKRALKSYLRELSKTDLEAQLLDLYTRFTPVKTYYDFVFNPKEDKLIQEAKSKISNEYFPVKRRKPKARRSVAQKYIKHFLTLGVEPHLVADLMCYNLEVAQTFSLERNVTEAFYKSMFNSFNELAKYVSINGLKPNFQERISKIYTETKKQQWPYEEDFDLAMDLIFTI